MRVVFCVGLAWAEKTGRAESPGEQERLGCLAGVGMGRPRHRDSGKGGWVPNVKFILELLTQGRLVRGFELGALKGVSRGLWQPVQAGRKAAVLRAGMLPGGYVVALLG